MSNFNLVFIEQQEAELRDQLFAVKDVEGAAYVLMRECKIAGDPWERRSRTKLVVREIIPIPAEDRVSSSAQHVTWDTKGFVALLQRCQREELVVGIAHCHPRGPQDFSVQDDENESELLRTACNRNGPSAKLVSILFYEDGGIRARVWQFPKHKADCKSVAVFGERFRFHFPAAPSPVSEVFARQVLAFGPSLMAQLKALRVGIIGAGGTGSATAMLAARAGAGQIVVVDDDIVEPTNLNRLHGATQSDADAMMGKADIAAREIARMGLGVRVVPLKGWANSPLVRDALKSCDVIFCCTDDNAGRIFLNRLAYFYFIPVIDMGLAMAVAKPPAVGMADISARVTTILPPETCLLCRDAVDTELAREEDLRRRNPTEYDRQKREAYVRGEGNPNPAVVTFTTEVACMAVNELLNRIVGYRKREMGSEHRRRFLFCEDRATSASPRNTCPICASKLYWGMADAEPFLDLVG
ncbi:ThiF family adenylyltransferase (plasmid) [Bradyrhizobium quebecense]|uniref:HesA/MoeB/ThiF family protein n=1 Tax=Bradyrhizobium quebecense TaxID=2748629 RepID=UPI001CD4382A|nr:ThiF family adenylyltransferase [Bradyrhizobium quebecense]UGA49061.1 ThiF family adenylyltransferase [Bradyrhizobium quebecense]